MVGQVPLCDIRTRPCNLDNHLQPGPQASGQSRQGFRLLKRVTVSIYRQTSLGPWLFHLFLKEVLGEFVLRACSSRCVCRLHAAPFLLLSVPCAWQGCPDRRRRAKTGRPSKAKRRGLSRSGRFGRHDLGSKAPQGGRQTDPSNLSKS